MTAQPYLIREVGIASLSKLYYNIPLKMEELMLKPDRIIDLTGKKFGKLTVKKLNGRIGKKYTWLCECECGGYITTYSSYLKTGDTRTCGCRFRIDETGNRYGKLLVIRSIKVKGIRGVKWICKCDCGKETIAFGGHLRSGSRRSCGCMHDVNIEKSGCKILYRTTKRKCEIKKREFKITLDEFYNLIKGDCFYCGSEPKQEIKRAKSKKTQIMYNGIDRIDSNMGYIKENCVSCCKRCNQSKSDLSVYDWKLHLLKIINHLGLK